MNNRSPDYDWNLLPWREQKRQEHHEHCLRFLCKTGLSAVLLVVGIHFFLLSLLRIQDQHNSVLHLSIEKLQPSMLVAQSLKLQTTVLQSRTQFLQQLIARQSQPAQSDL